MIDDPAPDPLLAELGYRVRWSLIFAAIVAGVVLVAWAVGSFLGATASRSSTTSTTALELGAGDLSDLLRRPLHPSRGEPRSPMPTAPPGSSAPPAGGLTSTLSSPSTLVAKPEPPQVSGYGYAGDPASLGRFRVTCYGPPQFPAGKHTATGDPVGDGSLAVDPRIIPLGTRLVLVLDTGPVDVVADDTGGAIRGHHVDLWRSSCAGWPNPTVELRRK